MPRASSTLPKIFLSPPIRCSTRSGPPSPCRPDRAGHFAESVDRYQSPPRHCTSCGLVDVATRLGTRPQAQRPADRSPQPRPIKGLAVGMAVFRPLAVANLMRGRADDYSITGMSDGRRHAHVGACIGSDPGGTPGLLDLVQVDMRIARVIPGDAVRADLIAWPGECGIDVDRTCFELDRRCGSAASKHESWRSVGFGVQRVPVHGSTARPYSRYGGAYSAG